jgi:hypothetical protein
MGVLGEWSLRISKGLMEEGREDRRVWLEL